MEKVRYMISDAATIAGVETHVLRYWEDELGLTVHRNEMGHRYYTRENIQEFQKIKELKEQGYQLKAIKAILHGEGTGQAAGIDKEPILQPPTFTPGQGVVQTPVAVPPLQEPAIPKKPNEPAETMTPEERMSQFRELMSDIVGRAIAHNNEELSQNIGKEVQERVLKEMNYLMREQDMASEERYKKLDAAIRGNVHRKKFLFAKSEKDSGKKNSKVINSKTSPAEQGA